MNIDVDKLMDTTVTVFHRVDAKAAGTKADAWYPHVIAPAWWYESHDRAVDADGSVKTTRAVRVQFPASSADYVQPSDYAAGGDAYTVETGDYVALGGFDVEPMGRAELLALLDKEQHATVNAVKDLRGNGGVSAPPVGVLKYASVVYVEGD